VLQQRYLARTAIPYQATEYRADRGLQEVQPLRRTAANRLFARGRLLIGPGRLVALALAQIASTVSQTQNWVIGCPRIGLRGLPLPSSTTPVACIGLPNQGPSIRGLPSTPTAHAKPVPRHP
jgi:hypothetical protein